MVQFPEWILKLDIEGLEEVKSHYEDQLSIVEGCSRCKKASNPQRSGVHNPLFDVICCGVKVGRGNIRVSGKEMQNIRRTFIETYRNMIHLFILRMEELRNMDSMNKPPPQIDIIPMHTTGDQTFQQTNRDTQTSNNADFARMEEPIFDKDDPEQNPLAITGNEERENSSILSPSDPQTSNNITNLLLIAGMMGG